MAACRLIALHINKGKTIAQCLADRTDYSQNAEKTNGGEYISSYECDPETADQEFLLSKRQYLQMTGRSITTSYIIPRHWTACTNSVISGVPAWRYSGSAI